MTKDLLDLVGATVCIVLALVSLVITLVAAFSNDSNRAAWGIAATFSFDLVAYEFCQNGMSRIKKEGQ